MDMWCTESKAVMKQSRVNHHTSFCSVKQITKVAEMPLTATDSIASTVFVQNKHLARREPALIIIRKEWHNCLVHLSSMKVQKCISSYYDMTTLILLLQYCMSFQMLLTLLHQCCYHGLINITSMQYQCL